MPLTDSTSQSSLLWPPEHHHPAAQPGFKLDAGSAADIGLDGVVAALDPNRYHSQDIQAMLLTLSADPAVLCYRQDVIQDLLDFPDLAVRLEDLLPKMVTLDHFGYSARPGQTALYEVVWRLGQLENYVECVQGLSAVFEGTGATIRSDGLGRLRDLVDTVRRDKTFQHLVKELPDMVARVRGICSVTVGVNLDDQLRPVEATLLAINNRKFTGESSSLLAAILGRSLMQNEFEGIAPLHSIAQNTPSLRSTLGSSVDNPLMYPLFRDLSHVLKQISRPIAAALRQYTAINVGVLSTLRVELAFYLGAVRLIRRMRTAGLPMCRPELAPQQERICELEDTYNLGLALRLLDRQNGGRLDSIIVTNDVCFGSEGRIFVLTGPNQGGKTTYTQAIGLVQVLAQAGLYVPARRARLSLVDGIYTHFPVEERPEMEAGRLGEEAQRLSDIFNRATRCSLVLLNESLSSTSPGESLYLARDIVRTLRLLGVRAVYATHLHELAAGVDSINAESAGDSKVVSLVSLVEEREGADQHTGMSIRQTYKIVPGPPMGRSYAREIASRYGISYEQLSGMLRRRGVVDGA